MIGVAPAWRTAFIVAAKVKFGTITSSPGPISVPSARCSADVPLEQLTHAFALCKNKLFFEQLDIFSVTRNPTT